jgi:hypothetical protein
MLMNSKNVIKQKEVGYMHNLKRILQKTVLFAVSITLVGGAPMVAFAEDPATYTYDSANQRWNTDKWVYDSKTGVYIPASTSSTTSAPAPASSTPSDSSTDKAAAPTSTTAAPAAGGDATVVDHANDSSNTNVNNDSKINNTLNSGTATGDAGVTSNQKAGGAVTGDANGDTTTVNSVHSTVGGDTSGIAHFTTNIYGDVTGDISIGPSIGNATIDRDININSNTNVNNDDAITNNLNIASNSGNANVKGNTQAGSAKSGNANAVANVLNLINTIIAANKSFIGTINIYGNLNGDILVSPDFIPQLLASNANNKVNIEMPLSSTTNINDDQSVINNIRLNATTGNANVKDNTGAGSATTGTAKTNLTVLNLTGHQVVAKKSLLVFVNVLGKWVGMIVDAPGATSAAFGSGVISDKVSVSDTNNLNNKSRITNNINLAAHSGDANVEDNTSAGDATTGDATASANIANISTDTFQLSDWFGVLFINVFGTWVGSFGVDTEAGTVVPLSGMALPQNNPAIGAPNMRFGFNPKNTPDAQVSAVGLGSGNNINGDPMAASALMTAANQPIVPGAPQLRAGVSPHEDPFSVVMMWSGFTIAGISGAWYVLRQWWESRRGRNVAKVAESVEAVPTGLVLPH